MEEVQEVVEARQRILEEEDEKLAHYARINLMPHTGKKTPKLEELRRYSGKKSQDSEQEQPKVVSMEERRERKEAIAAARKRIPWNSGKKSG